MRNICFYATEARPIDSGSRTTGTLLLLAAYPVPLGSVGTSTLMHHAPPLPTPPHPHILLLSARMEDLKRKPLHLWIIIPPFFFKPLPSWHSTACSVVQCRGTPPLLTPSHPRSPLTEGCRSSLGGAAPSCGSKRVVPPSRIRSNISADVSLMPTPCRCGSFLLSVVFKQL